MAAEETRERQLTREALYELVWSEPMQVLGPRFGVSDVGLKKACKRLRIPTPGRGYWAKQAVGKAPRRTPLPMLPDSVRPEQQVARFERPPRATPEEAALARGPVPDQKRYEAVPEHRIFVAETLSNPHKLVATSVLLLRSAKTNEQHRLVPRGSRCLALAVTLGTADRAMLVFDALIKACEARGWSVDVKDDENSSITAVSVDAEVVGVCIEELVTRLERRPDPKANRSYYHKEYDYLPTGRLTVRLDASYLGVRQSWSDGAKQRVEECLNDLMVGLVAAAEALKARRLEREAREREYRAEEERRRLAERRRQEEAGRVRALKADLNAWRICRAAREYASAMREAANTAGLLGDGAPLTGWLGWVETYADRIDPTRSPRVPRDPDPHGAHSYRADREHNDQRMDW